MGQEYFDYQDYKREVEQKRLYESYSRDNTGYDDEVDYIEELRDELKY